MAIAAVSCATSSFPLPFMTGSRTLYGTAAVLLVASQACASLALADVTAGGGAGVSSSSAALSSPQTSCNGKAATISVSNGVIVGGPGNGQTFTGTLNGTSADDVIVGVNADTAVNGNGGNDTICTFTGNDVIDTTND